MPLGPFLAKNFGTTISPWIVTMDALAPFKCPAPEQNPEPLRYLKSEGNRTYNIHLEVNLTSEGSDKMEPIVQSNFNYLYWDIHQQLAHHTATGCDVRTGDLMASGTISGPAKKTEAVCWNSLGEERNLLLSQAAILESFFKMVIR